MNELLTNAELLRVLSIAIALAAYTAAVKRQLISKGKYTYAKCLTLADVPLIVSSVLLSISLYVKVFLSQEIKSLISWGMGILGLALVILAGFHIYEWFRIFSPSNEPSNKE